MRKTVFFLIIVFFVSCGPKLEEKESLETYPGDKPKRVQYYTPGAENSYMAKIFFYAERSE